MLGADALVVMTAPPGLDLLGLWHAIQDGGVTFLLFLAVLALFTGQVSSRRQADQLLKMQTDRYAENDARWAERFRDEKARADRMEQLLFQQAAVANRIGAIAERVAASSATLQDARPGGV